MFQLRTECHGQAYLLQGKCCQYSARMFALVLEQKSTVNITMRVSHVAKLWGLLVQQACCRESNAT